MNTDQFEGRWEQVKGDVRRHFGKLTDDDMAQIKGRRENLIGRIRERYGDAKEAAAQKVDAFLETLQQKTA